MHFRRKVHILAVYLLKVL